MLKIGMVGMSPGNAHPTSWSAIINGTFNAGKITELGFPGVAAYLSLNRASLGLPDACVTHIFTQEKRLSQQIAATAGIAHVAGSAEELINYVDAVILGRDDPENHVAMAKPFIEAGIPLFIDKPLCSTLQDLEYFAGEVAKGKFILSCSSMRYSEEISHAKTLLPGLGRIELVTATGKKDWIKYGVHMLEAAFSLLDDPQPVSVINIGEPGREVVKIALEDGRQITLHLFADIALTFQLSVFGQENWHLIDIKNYYAMFRKNIEVFIASLKAGKPLLDFAHTENIIRTLIAGQQSREKGGLKIDLHAH